MSSLTSTKYVELKRSIYREYSRSYDVDRRQFAGAGALGARITWALEPLRPGHSVLDLGCGSGALLLDALQNRGGEGARVGMDLTPEMLDLAGDRLGRAAGLIQANALDGLPFRDSSFHLVTSLNLIQELPASAIPPLLAEVFRVLRPGGAFRAVIPCMVEDNAACQAFRELACLRGAMEFYPAEELEQLLGGIPNFDHLEFHVAPSPAASAAATGKTRFKLFTGIIDEIRDRGLEPRQVKQGVLFFAAQRDKES